MGFFSWLFSLSIFSYIFWGLIVVGIVFLIIKKDWAKIVAGIIGGIASFGLLVFCCYNLNLNYSAEGGIFGKMASVFKKPSVTIEKTLTSTKLTFKDIILTKEYDNQENLYSTTIKSTETFDLSGNDYLVLINGTPLRTEVFNNNITAYFENAFYGDDNKVKYEDALRINVFFYENYTNLKLSTEGGLKACGYWLNYFEKENFVVEIKEVEGSYKSTADIYEVRFVDRFRIDRTMQFKAGSEIKLPKLKIDGYNFIGWSLEKEGSIIDSDTTLKVNSDMVLYDNWEVDEEALMFYRLEVSNYLKISDADLTDEQDFLKKVAKAIDCPNVSDPTRGGILHHLGSNRVDIIENQEGEKYVYYFGDELTFAKDLYDFYFSK